MLNNPLYFILHFVFPYGIMLGSLFLLIGYLEKKYIGANEDRVLKKLITIAIIIGVPAIFIEWIVSQPWWGTFSDHVHNLAEFTKAQPLFGILIARTQVFNGYVKNIFVTWFPVYWDAFVVIYFIGILIEFLALKWRISFSRTFNVLVPIFFTFPRIFEYCIGKQTPIEDKILEGKIKGKLKENLNDSYEDAAAGESSYREGAGGSSAEATKVAVAVATRRSSVTVRTTADGKRVARLFVKQSRETETDRAIENTLKGFGSRISGNSIYFPNDPTFSPKDGGYIFDSSIPYDAGKRLGEFKKVFSDPFSLDNKTSQGGKGAIKAYFHIILSLLKYVFSITPYSIYKRFIINADKKFKIDTSTSNAKFIVQQNLDLSVIPEPKADGNTIEVQRQKALQRANNRISDVTTALSSVKISGQFKDVQVGGSTAIYTYTLPPDPNLPSDFKKVQEQFSNLLRLNSKPIITLDAGLLKVSIDNNISIPVSFTDMIKRRKTGVSNIISGIAGIDPMGEPIYFELGDKNPHVMVFGKTGTGKTVLIMSILYSIMSATDPKHLRVLYVDGKGNSFEFMSKDSAHPNPFTYAPPGDASGDIEYARAVIRYVEMETRRRINLFKKAEVSKLADYNKVLESQGKDILPEILFVVDEFSAITQQDKDLKASEINKFGTIDRFEYIAKMSRSVGIRMLMANQSARKELVPGKVSANITARVSLGVSEPIESEIALPETGIAVHLVSRPGEFYSTLKGPLNAEHGYCPYLPDEVMQALNDSLVKKFGPCEYEVTREEILESEETQDEMVSDLGISPENILVPEPEPTAETPLDIIDSLGEQYYPWLYMHRNIVTNNTEANVALKYKLDEATAKIHKIISKLDAWRQVQLNAQNANTHRSTGELVKSTTNGRDLDKI